MRKISIISLIALACVPQLVHAEAYKCKQADGSLGFQDHPCQGSASGSMIGLPPVQGYSPGSNGATPSTPGLNRPRAAAVRDGETERANSENRAYNARVMAENKAVRCNAARQQLGVMTEQRPVYRRDNAGNRIYVEDKDRPAAIAAAQQRIDSDCP